MNSEDVAALAVCQLDPRWPRMTEAARRTWLRNSRRGKPYRAAVNALQLVRLRLEGLRDAEPNDGTSPLYAGLARALGEITAMEAEQEA